MTPKLPVATAIIAVVLIYIPVRSAGGWLSFGLAKLGKFIPLEEDRWSTIAT